MSLNESSLLDRNKRVRGIRLVKESIRERGTKSGIT